MLRIINFNVAFADPASLTELTAKRLKLPPQAVSEVVIVRKAVDARRYKKAPIYFVYTVDVKLNTNENKVLEHLRKDKNVTKQPSLPAEEPGVCREKSAARMRPVIAGFGPAGIFAALNLARQGYAPLVLERGLDVDQRQAAINKFWQSGQLSAETNVQFGEGGAGTFSDGKLTTRISDPHMQQILQDFVAAGAPEEILYLHTPHIGTDILRRVIKNIRQEIIRLGGTVRFGAKVTDLCLQDGAVTGIIVNETEKIPCDTLFMGIGHSARDTYRMLHKHQAAMEAKPFAIGVRIEHPQEWIDFSQYGDDFKNPLLPRADYALTYKDAENGRGAYSFCMCPGGVVVAASSAKNHVVTNGMSNYSRSSGIANSALLVTAGPDDFGHEPLDGIVFQEKYEQLAFVQGGENYFAPVQTVGDFLAGKTGAEDFLCTPTYRPGVKAADLRSCLPSFVTDTLARALPHFGRKIKGFDDSRVLMTGIESRSSAPCRIRRNRESFLSENIAGLYPIGEGAGYAGGIMSAAVDGRNAACAFMSGTAK